ncbi:MAG: GNAT family N-acetyltransferase [Ignavibacteriota bacterium]
MGEVRLRSEVSEADITAIINAHRSIYEREFGFNQEFGEYVAASLKGDFAQIWIAETEGRFAGCIGVVKAAELSIQLRWFLVEPEFQGKGIGKLLIEALLEYCRAKKFDEIFLWTVNKLPAAKAIYERYGFERTQTKAEQVLWGQPLLEERWDLSLKREG